MKKAAAIILGIMIMILSVSAFAAGQNEQRLTLEEAKAIALKQVDVTEEEARFTKENLDRDDGRLVYEIEFYVGNIEYDMDVDAYTGAVTDFSSEAHFSYGDDDRHDWDDRYDDDRYDWDDRYDNDWDDLFDWD